MGRCKAAVAGVQHGKQLYAPPVSLCSFQGREVPKLWNGGNSEATLEKPEFFCPWKSPCSHSSVLLCPTFSERRQWLSSIPSPLPAFSFWQSCTGPCRQGMESMRPGWQLGAGKMQVGCPGFCRCRAIQTMHLPCSPPTLWAISCAGPSSHVSAACLSSVLFLNGNTRLRISNALPFPPELVVQQAQGSLAASLGWASQCRAGSRTSHSQG